MAEPDEVTQKILELIGYENEALIAEGGTYGPITEACLLRFHIRSRMRHFGMGLEEGMDSDSLFGYIRRAVDLLLLQLQRETLQQEEYGVVTPECLARGYEQGFPMLSPEPEFDPRSGRKRRAEQGSEGQGPSKRRRSGPQQQPQQQQQRPASPPRRSPSPDHLRVLEPSRWYGTLPPPRPLDKDANSRFFDRHDIAAAAEEFAAAVDACVAAATGVDDASELSTPSGASTTTYPYASSSCSAAAASTTSSSCTAAAAAASTPPCSPPASPAPAASTPPCSPPASPAPAAASRPLPPPPRRQPPRGVKTPSSPPATVRRRRHRCGVCTACRTANCGSCKECSDMPCFGGPGRRKQCCVLRRCSNVQHFSH